MHDPLTVAFEIRRPWPCSAAWKTRTAAAQGIRWQLRGSSWVLAGRGFYWPCMVTIWHRDPSGYDSTTCSTRRRVWRFHVHHWRIQVSPLQHLRRRLLTRCTKCGGRSTKQHPVDVGQWGGTKARWWRGEANLTHYRCPEQDGDR